MATEVEMKTLVCPGPPEHEFEIPKGRGRPPRYCREHDPRNNPDNSEKKPEGGSRPAPGATRPKPGGNGKSESEATRKAPPGVGETRKPPRVAPPLKDSKDAPVETAERAAMTDRGTIRKLPSAGTPDVGSRAKAESAANRAVAQEADFAWPRGITGRPMARIEFAASELIPTGQYANVSVGPARITAFVDLDYAGDLDKGVFSKRELQILAQAANELAETAEAKVIAVQRDIVLMALQNPEGSNGNS